MQIISVHSFRGGTGKSNTTANLAVLAARAGHRVAIVDTDIQSPGIHAIFGLEPDRITHTLNDYLWGKCSIETAAYDFSSLTATDPASSFSSGLYLVPSSIESAQIGRILREGYDVARLNEGFQQLIGALKLDVLLIDTHPGVNDETLLSIAISDTLVLMMRPDKQDFQGTAVTVELARRLEIPEMLLVVNKVPLGVNTQTLRERMEGMYHAEVAGLLPLNHEIVHVASSGVFALRYPDHPFTQELRSIAARVVRPRAVAPS